MFRKFVFIGIAWQFIFAGSSAQAQSTEERFQDLFLTAGYSTAFGAALGAAFLAFTDNPSSQLRYIGMGASLGFIGGSILGTYIIFSPLVTTNENQAPLYVASNSIQSDRSQRHPRAPIATRTQFQFSPIVSTSRSRPFEPAGFQGILSYPLH